RDLIERLLARMASSRILVLITHRPEFRPDWTRHPHVTTLTLNRLSRGQAVEVARAAGGAMLSEEIVAIIGERAGGVPLFIDRAKFCRGGRGDQGHRRQHHPIAVVED